MPNEALPRNIAEMPVQLPAAPGSKAEARGRFFNTGNAFNVQLPVVPDRIFSEEAARALDPDAPTGVIACDISDDLACAFPATTPLVLARYARIRSGGHLDTDFAASGVIAYVIAGSGTTLCAGEAIAWDAGARRHLARPRPRSCIIAATRSHARSCCCTKPAAAPKLPDRR